LRRIIAHYGIISLNFTENTVPMRKYLYFTVFISGLVSLAIEMSASRLLGNVFGTSNLVWAAIIGLILIYLAAGYFIGGAWADRSPHFRTLFLILLGAALATAIVPVISRPVLRIAADAFDQLQMGILFGSFTAVIILLIVPMTLLGIVSPFAIRLAIQQTENAGRISGRLYAVSTLGSFFGTFLPVLLLIPTIGTYRTFLVLAALLALIAIIGLILTSGKLVIPALLIPLVLLPVLAIWGLPGRDKNTQGIIYETESTYNYIQVLESNGYRYLRLNEGQGVHSMYHPSVLYYGGPWEMVLAAPLFSKTTFQVNNIHSMAIIGLAAGTTARQATSVYPNIAIDGIEIDPKIVEVGKKYFGMDLPNLNILVQDGRWALDQSEKTYQIISVDAYRPPYIPAQLTTQEFFHSVYNHLTDDGVMIINVGRAPEDRRLINALSSTILSIFPSLYVVDLPGTFNSLIYATRQPTTNENLYQNFAALQNSGNAPDLLVTVGSVAIASLQPSPEKAQVFTDDKAPVEWITNNMVLRFLLSPEMESLQ
jgi:spermidine synthase